MNEVVKLPDELSELALKVPESKQDEVKKVLNDIFNGTANWEKQVDLIEVKDINDNMSIQLADAARKNAKTARLNGEKIFDKKRSEVQLRMMDDKLEDALWLKSKQIMQLQFKHIEEKAKFKSEFVKRHEAEQLQLRNDLRYQKVLNYIPDEEISSLEIAQMSDGVFEVYLSGIEKVYKDKIEAEKKAKEEAERLELIEKLSNERYMVLIPFSDFFEGEEKEVVLSDKLGEISIEDYEKLLKNLNTRKTKHEAEQEKIRKENERLKKEAEQKKRDELKKQKDLEKKLLAEKEKRRLAAIQFLFDHGFENTHGGMQLSVYSYFIGANHYSDLDTEKEFDSFCDGVVKSIETSKVKKEQADTAAKLKAKEDEEKAEKAKVKRIADEEKEAARKAALAPEKDKITSWIDSFNIDELDNSKFSSSGKSTVELISKKFEAFKNWANDQKEALK